MAWKCRGFTHQYVRRRQLTATVCLTVIIVFIFTNAYKKSGSKGSASEVELYNHPESDQLPEINRHLIQKQMQLKPIANVENAKTYEAIFGSNTIVQEIKFSFLINPFNLCSDRDVFVIIYIHSALENRDERQRIRQCWASVKAVNVQSIVSVFLLGTTNNAATQASIEKESSEFGDLVQGDFHDSYHNLTHKNLMGLKWIVNYCPQSQFVVKVDDDTLIDPYHLVNFLLKPPQHLSSNEDFIYCSVMSHIGVPKNPDDKWHIEARDYPYRYYPPYCEGFGYILSVITAEKLLDMAAYVPYFWIDDVYVTGFLSFRLDLHLTNVVHGHGTRLLTPHPSSDYITNNIFFLAKNSFYAKHWDETWDKIKNLRSFEP